MSVQPLILFFKDIDKNDTELVGGKSANLGEMTKAGFPVPKGFAITVEAYDRFLSENNLSAKIYKILQHTNYEDTANLENSAKEIQKMMKFGEVPEDIS